MATGTTAKTKAGKTNVNASVGAKADTSKNLSKGTTANAGAYSEAEAGAQAKAKKGNVSANVGAHAEVGAYSNVENETKIAGPVKVT